MLLSAAGTWWGFVFLFFFLPTLGAPRALRRLAGALLLMQTLDLVAYREDQVPAAEFAAYVMPGVLGVFVTALVAWARRQRPAVRGAAARG